MIRVHISRDPFYLFTFQAQELLKDIGTQRHYLDKWSQNEGKTDSTDSCQVLTVQVNVKND